MLFKSFLLAAALLGIAASAGNGMIANRCPYDIWVEHVNGPIVSPLVKIPARSIFNRRLELPSVPGSGIVLKISRSAAIVAGHHTQFEYAIDAGRSMLYYDISYVNCAVGKSAGNCPGHTLGHAVTSPEPACGTINCQGGSYCPTQAYYVDKPVQKLGIAEPVFGCGNKGYKMDLKFIMCSNQPNVQTKRSIAGRIDVYDDGEIA